MTVNIARYLADLPVDSTARLSSHLLLIHRDFRALGGAYLFKSSDLLREHPNLQLYLAEGEVADLLMPKKRDGGKTTNFGWASSLGCLERGMPRGLISSTTFRRPPGTLRDMRDVHAWIRKECETIEVCRSTACLLMTRPAVVAFLCAHAGGFHQLP